MRDDAVKALIGPNIMGLEHSLPALQAEFADVSFSSCTRKEALVTAIADAEVYIGALGRADFQAASRLIWVQSTSSGVNHYLAIPELAEGDVLLTSASGTHGACVADSAMAMILAFTRGIRDSVVSQQKRAWAMWEIRPGQRELTGATMGIVGFGAIGTALATRARAFGMRVIAVDLYPGRDTPDLEWLRGVAALPDLLREADYVVVTVPYTGETLALIGPHELSLMKPSAMLVGMSRGGVIDQAALAGALREGRLAQAALDVFEQEPLPAESELWGLDNLLIAPHIAGGTQLEAEYLIGIFRENLWRYLRGEYPLRNQVDKRRGF